MNVGEDSRYILTSIMKLVLPYFAGTYTVV